MAKRLKVAVVGASISNSPDGRERFAIRAHLPALKNLHDLYDVVAVCTTRMETANETARRFDVPHAFDNVERMLQRIAGNRCGLRRVRPVVHHQVVMAALRAGKHVYCEQPLGVTTAQAKEMFDLARDKGVRTVVGHQYHYDPAVLQMADMVRQGYIGKPLAFNSSNFGPQPYRAAARTASGCFSRRRAAIPVFAAHSLERVISVLGDVERGLRRHAGAGAGTPQSGWRPAIENHAGQQSQFPDAGWRRCDGNAAGFAHRMVRHRLDLPGLRHRRHADGQS